MWCLPSYVADQFLDKIRSGDISPEKMLAMSSAERRAFFADFMGEENARQANTLLETKLILKNQQKGMVTWAKRIAGQTPEAKRGIINRVNKMSEPLTAENEDAFLEDLASHVVGTAVTMEEMSNITTLAAEVEEAKVAMEAGPRRKLGAKPTATEMTYGRAVVAFNNYVGVLNEQAEHKTVSERAIEYLRNPFKFISDAFNGIAATSRELRTTLDNSFILKQGRPLFFKGIAGDFKSGRLWWDSFKKSFEIFYKSFSGQQVIDELNAEIWSDPEYDLIKKANVAIMTTEEEMPTDWYRHIPYIGRPFTASHDAYTGTAHYMRYRTAKHYFDVARKAGVDLTSKEELRGIGNLVNSLTGRGDTGTRQEPGLVNNVFFSPRMLKADWDIVTAHAFDRKATTFAKKEAAKNLARIIAAQAIIMALAYLWDDDFVELDPRSADFGKIRVGNTRFDISGGVGALTRLAARLMPLIIFQNAAYKSTTTGEVVTLNTDKFGARTGLDILEDFLENKTAPLFSLLLSHLEGEYRYEPGIKPSVIGDVRRLTVPLPIENVIELKNDDKSANIVLASLLDMLGVFTSTYGPYWGKMSKPELEAEIKKNTHQRRGKRDDGTKYQKGDPHKGQEAKLRGLNKELETR